MKSVGAPAGDAPSLKKDDVARSPWFEIKIERESHGEGRISEVLGDDVETPLALGRSGERGFRY